MEKNLISIRQYYIRTLESTIQHQNRGTHVTQPYARVFTSDGIDEPRVCPQYPDKIREGAEVREAKSQRRG